MPRRCCLNQSGAAEKASVALITTVWTKAEKPERSFPPVCAYTVRVGRVTPWASAHLYILSVQFRARRVAEAEAFRAHPLDLLSEEPQPGSESVEGLLKRG
jgi:hypothetical protein